MTVTINRDDSRESTLLTSSASRLQAKKTTKLAAMTRILANEHQRAVIKPHCMGRKGPSQTEEDVRRFIDAVVWIGGNGAPWRELPSRLGKWNTVFKRFRRWTRDGVFRSVSNALDVDIDRECVMIDAAVFQVHQPGQGARGERPAKP